MRIRVHVSPGARRERLEESKRGIFTIAVREKAKGGEANNRVRELLAFHFGVALTQVRFISGAYSERKSFEIV